VSPSSILNCALDGGIVQQIRQEPSITGIKIFGHEIKLSQFADDTNLFCADFISVENALKTVGDSGRLAGLK